MLNIVQCSTLCSGRERRAFDPTQCGPLSLVEAQRGSALIGRELHSVAPPAILCHKEPARRIQSPLLGALERKKPPMP